MRLPVIEEARTAGALVARAGQQELKYNRIKANLQPSTLSCPDIVSARLDRGLPPPYRKRITGTLSLCLQLKELSPDIGSGHA